MLSGILLGPVFIFYGLEPVGVNPDTLTSAPRVLSLPQGLNHRYSLPVTGLH